MHSKNQCPFIKTECILCPYIYLSGDFIVLLDHRKLRWEGAVLFYLKKAKATLLFMQVRYRGRGWGESMAFTLQKFEVYFKMYIIKLFKNLPSGCEFYFISPLRTCQSSGWTVSSRGKAALQCQREKQRKKPKRVMMWGWKVGSIEAIMLWQWPNMSTFPHPQSWRSSQMCHFSLLFFIPFDR